MGLSRGVPLVCLGRLAGALGAASALLVAACTMPQDVYVPDIPVSAAVVPTSGLIGEWKLDTTGGTLAKDTKNGFNATVFGGAAFVTGKLGNALNLNNGSTGTGGKYAEMPSNATLDNVQEGDYTISAWFNPASVPGNDSVGNRNWSIVVKAGQHMGLVYGNDQRFAARHYLTGDVLKEATSSSTSAINSWYHVASVVSKAQGSVKIYLNGNLAGTTTFTANTAAREYGTKPFRIGRAQTNWAANGKVDQVRIYNRALSASEVADLFNETPGATGIPFGLWGTKPDTVASGAIWTGGVLANKNLSLVVTQLQAAQMHSPRIRMWYTLTGGNEEVFKNGTGGFDLEAWKDTLDNHAGPFNPDSTSSFYDDLLPFIQDGTFQGAVMLDDLANFTPDPSFADIEGMAAHMKKRFPTLTTAVRARATYLETTSGGASYTKLDAGWGQYRSGLGQSAAQYRDAEIAAATRVKLGLVLGINITDGGPPFGTSVSTDTLKSWGDSLLKASQSDYACGFLMWDNTYPNVSHPNMTTLAGKANSHVAAPCKRRP